MLLTTPFLWLSVLGMTQAFSGAPVVTRNSDATTVHAIKRALHEVKGTTYSLNKTSIAKSWSDATLFSLGASKNVPANKNASVELAAGIAVVCSTCYVSGSVSGSLSVGGGFNVTKAVDGVAAEIKNVTVDAVEALDNWVKELPGAIEHDILELELDLPAFPTLDFDFDLEDVGGFPDVHAQFRLDDLDLYLELDVQLSVGATYTLPLFTSETIAGISIPGLDAGALLKVSLVLIADAQVDIGSGVHIKLDDSLLLDFELFNKNVSDISLPHAQVEVLPVTIQGQGSLRALLQLQASIGFNIATPSTTFLSELGSLSAGISAQAFAYIADLLLQVDASPSSDECELAAVAEYTMAVGGAAGATVAVDVLGNAHSWGPAPSTTIPVWYTTLASVCAASKTAPTITSSAALQQRDDEELTTTTLSTSTTYTIVNCVSTGLINCPVHLQTTTSAERTMTTVLTVPADADPTFPESTFASVTSTVGFGGNVHRVSGTSGVPSSYVPPPTPVSTSGGSSSPTGNEGGGGGGGDDSHHNNNKLIIGLSVGLGVPALAVVAFGIGWFLYRRRQEAESKPEAESFLGTPKTPHTAVVADSD